MIYVFLNRLEPCFSAFVFKTLIHINYFKDFFFFLFFLSTAKDLLLLYKFNDILIRMFLFQQENLTDEHMAQSSQQSMLMLELTGECINDLKNFICVVRV